MTKAVQKTAPESLSPIAFNIPDAFETKLDNGLRIVAFQDNRLPLVSYRLAFITGDINDPADNIGLHSAVAALLTEGTRNYSSKELAERIERLGASVSANSSDDFTLVAASSLSLYNSEMLDLLAEVVLLPTFPENELDLYRRNTVEHLKFQRSQAGFLAGEQSARLLYGEHPYSRVTATAEDIEKITRQQLAEVHKLSYIPNNAIMIVVGDVDKDTLVKDIGDRFNRWAAGETPADEPSTLRGRTNRTLTIVDRPGSAQSNIVIGNLAIDRRSPDYFPFLVMNQVLGAGASSRLFMNLREEKGYTYGAYSRFDAKRLGGDFEATAEVRSAVTGESLKEFFLELDRIRDDRVTDSELDDAKNFLTGVLPIRAETQEGLTNLIVSQYLYGLPQDYLQTYRDNVRAVTAEQVKEVAAKYIKPDRMAIVLVGDAREILPQASDYCEIVEILDANGNRLDVDHFRVDESAKPADVGGEWSLVIDFQGQGMPVTLKLTQSNEDVTGTIETMLGTGQISAGKIRATRLSATATTEIQGETVEFVITGTVSGDSMSGTLSAPIVPEPLSFTGSRVQ